MRLRFSLTAQPSSYAIRRVARVISAVVLVPDGTVETVTARRETAVRSLGWLVSAVVAGVVRDVTLAASAAIELAEVADKVGCRLVVAEREGERLREAARLSRCDRLIVLQSGFQPVGNLVDEIDTTQCRGVGNGAVVLRTPVSFRERLFPESAAVVGVVTSKTQTIEAGAGGFAGLARTAKRYRRLHTRVQPIP